MADKRPHLAHSEGCGVTPASFDPRLCGTHEAVDTRGLSIGLCLRLFTIFTPAGILDTVMAQQFMEAPGRLNFQHVVFVERSLAHGSLPAVGDSGNQASSLLAVRGGSEGVIFGPARF